MPVTLLRCFSDANFESSIVGFRFAMSDVFIRLPAEMSPQTMESNVMHVVSCSILLWYCRIRRPMQDIFD